MRSNFGTFSILWIAHVVSTIGSQLTGFGIGLWFFERTHSTTLYGLIAASALLPSLLAAPVAGALIDRWNRGTAMRIGQAGSGAIAILFCCLLAAGALLAPVVVVGIAARSLFNGLQTLALSAATSQLVPARHLGRANGMVQLGGAVVQILVPMTAGILLPKAGLGGILTIDVVAFLLAIAAFTAIRVPPTKAGEMASRPKASLRAENGQAIRYLRTNSGLALLLLFFAVSSFNLGAIQVLITPLVLGFADTVALGAVSSAGGLGMLVGSFLMIAWGGPRRRVLAVLGFSCLQGLLLLLGAAKPSTFLAGAAAFGFLFTIPLIAGCNQTIWQRTVPADLQGRVFSLKNVLGGGTMPLAFLIAGPLADGVFEPLMRHDGPLASTAGLVLGTGRGRGIALMFVVLGCASILSALLSGLHPKVRGLDDAADAAP